MKSLGKSIIFASQTKNHHLFDDEIRVKTWRSFISIIEDHVFV